MESESSVVVRGFEFLNWLMQVSSAYWPYYCCQLLREAVAKRGGAQL